MANAEVMKTLFRINLRYSMFLFCGCKSVMVKSVIVKSVKGAACC